MRALTNLADELRTGDFNKILTRITPGVESFGLQLVFIDSFRSVTLAPRGESA